MRLKICVAVLLLSVLSVLAIGHVVRTTDTGTGAPEATPAISLAQASVTRPQVPVVVEGALSPNTRGWSRSSGSVDSAAATGLPAELVDAYTLAVASSPAACHLSLSLLAAIGQVESRNLAGRSIDASHRVVPAILGPVLNGHGFAPIKDTDAGQWDGSSVWDRALGPLQFLPGSWRVVGLDLDGDGLRDPQNVYDAAGAAMVYLCSGGRDLGTTSGLRQAVLAYNHSAGYLEQVLAWKTVFDAADLTGVLAATATGLWAVPQVTAAPLPAADVATRTPSQPTDTVATAVPTAASLGSSALPSASVSPGQAAGTTRPSSSAPSPGAPSSSAAPQPSEAPRPSESTSSSASAEPTCPSPTPTATPTEPAPTPPTPSATLGPDGCPIPTPSIEPSASASPAG